MTPINNLPSDYLEYPFIVARWCDGAWWYYGVYSTIERAVAAAVRVDGLFWPTEYVIPGEW